MKNLAKRDYFILLLIIFISYFLINTIPSSVLKFGDFQFMFNMYAFGAYYKLYGKKVKYSLIYSFGCFAIMIASEIAIVILGNFLNSDAIIGKYGPLFSYSNIFSFGFAFFLFAYFANKEYHSDLVNKISSTTLGIYMLHDNQLIYQMIWVKLSPNANYTNNPYLHSILKIFLVFIASMIIDFIRQITIKKVFDKNVYPKIYKLIDSKTSLEKVRFLLGQLK